MSTAALSVDPLWPRAGDWPALETLGDDARADLALLGLPTWRTSLSPTGAHATPAAVRSALRRYSTHTAGAAVDRLRLVDEGDVVEPDGPEGEARAIAAMRAAAARSTVTVAVGGDNSLTVPAALGAFGDDLRTAGLITLDAHHDLRDGVSNGSPVRRLVEAGLAGTRIVQIGIADFANSAAYTRRAEELGITVVPRDALHGRPLDDVMAEALDIAGASAGPVHVDLDVDVCDRSVAPGCPASVPGGLAAWELRRFARLAAASPRVRSLDIAEVDATADAADQRTVRLAALLVLEAVAGLASRAS
ncbi:arginase family protein [Leifsonia sp. ZF2019]|uniref:arginase family protein n=1 Tax=Leifsonia sp. ZF2019 TaxID=2781978 RepID=UPI001CC13FA2|nr:arginase family protein [Leifsonia sp. ZF2019]UAJ79068.1 arginase family protein [Leifsonia sp. ZF2019]